MRTTIPLVALLVACRNDDAPAATTGAPSHAELAAALIPVLTTLDAESLIPEAAPIVGRVDVKALLASDLYKANAPVLESRAKTALDILKTCSLGLEKLEHITFGFDPFAQDHAIVVDAEGIGRQRTLECVNAAMTAEQGRAPWTVGERAGTTVLEMRDGESFGYVLGDDRLVLVSKRWTEAMDGLVDRKGTSAFAGKLAAAIARADTKQVLWIAGTLPADFMKVTVAAGAKDFAASLDLTSGAAFTASFGYASADEANDKRAHVQTQFDELKGMAPSMGVPQAVVDSVEFTAHETSLVITLRANDADLRTLQEKIGKAFLGW